MIEVTQVPITHAAKLWLWGVGVGMSFWLPRVHVCMALIINTLITTHNNYVFIPCSDEGQGLQ